MHINAIKKLKDFGSYQCDIPLQLLEVKVANWIVEDNLNLLPDFQRGHVWFPQQQIAFVEFILKGGKTQPLLFNHPGWMKAFTGEFVIVDGLQRLTALLKFLSNDLDVFGDYRRKEIEGLESYLRSLSIKLYINDLKTKAEVLEWYLELNAGGTVHTEEELGRVRNLLIDEYMKNINS